MIIYPIIGFFCILKLTKGVQESTATLNVQSDIQFLNLISTKKSQPCETDCRECDSSGKCIKCKFGYFHDVDTVNGNKCILCPCDDCGTNPVWEEKKQCMVGSVNKAFYLDKSTPTAPVFKECTVGCAKCISATKCLECSGKYHMEMISSGSIQCKACPTNCPTCFLGSESKDGTGEIMLYTTIDRLKDYATYSKYISDNTFKSYCSSCDTDYALNPADLSCTACSSITSCKTCSYIKSDDRNRLSNLDSYNSDFLNRFKELWGKLKAETRAIKCLLCTSPKTMNADLSACEDCNSNCKECTYGNDKISIKNELGEFPRTSAETAKDTTITKRCVKCDATFMISYDLTGCQSCGDHLNNCQICRLVKGSAILDYKSNPIASTDVEISKDLLKAEKDKKTAAENAGNSHTIAVTFDSNKWHGECVECSEKYGPGPFKTDCLECKLSDCTKCSFLSESVEQCKECDPKKTGSHRLNIKDYKCEKRELGHPSEAECPKVISPHVFNQNAPKSINCQTCPGDQVPDLNGGSCRSCDSNCQKCSLDIGEIDVSNMLDKDPFGLIETNFYTKNLLPNRHKLIVCDQCKPAKYVDLKTKQCFDCPQECSVCTQVLVNYKPVIECSSCADLDRGEIYVPANLAGLTQDRYFNYYYYDDYLIASPANTYNEAKATAATNFISTLLGTHKMKSVHNPSTKTCGLCPLGCDDCVHFPMNAHTTALSYLQTYNTYCKGNCRTGFLYDKSTGRCRYCKRDSDSSKNEICSFKKIIKVSLDCFIATPNYDKESDTLKVSTIDQMFEQLNKYFEVNPMIIFNELGIEELEIRVTAEKTSLCEYKALSPDQRFRAILPFKERILSVKKVLFELKSSSPTNKLKFIGITDFTFDGFTDLILTDIIIDYDISQLSFTPNIENYTLSINNLNTLTMTNIDLLGYDATPTDVAKSLYPAFHFNNVKSVKMTNIFMSKFKMKEKKSIFQTLEAIYVMNEAEVIDIEKFTLAESILHHQSLFENSKISKLKFTLKEFKMNNTKIYEGTLLNLFQTTQSSVQIDKSLTIQYLDIITVTGVGFSVLTSNFYNSTAIDHVSIRESKFSNIFTTGFKYALLQTDYMILTNFTFASNTLDQISVFRNELEYKTNHPLYQLKDILFYRNNFTNMLRPIFVDMKDLNKGLGTNALFKITNASFSANIGDNVNPLSDPFLIYLENFGIVNMEQILLSDNQYINIMNLKTGLFVKFVDVKIQRSIGSQFSRMTTITFEDVNYFHFTNFHAIRLNEKAGLVRFYDNSQDGNSIQDIVLERVKIDGLNMLTYDTDIAAAFIFQSAQQLKVRFDYPEVYNVEMIKPTQFLSNTAASIISFDSPTSEVQVKDGSFKHCTAKAFYLRAKTITMTNLTMENFYVKFKEGGNLNPNVYDPNVAFRGGALVVDGANSVTLVSVVLSRIVSYMAGIMALKFDGLGVATLNINSMGASAIETSSGVSGFHLDHLAKGNVKIAITNSVFTGISTKSGSSIFAINSNIQQTELEITNVNISNASCKGQLIAENFRPITVKILKMNVSKVGSEEIYNQISVPLDIRNGFLFNDYSFANLTEFTMDLVDSYNPIIRAKVPNATLILNRSSFSNCHMIDAPIIHTTIAQDMKINNLTINQVKFSSKVQTSNNNSNQFYKRRLLQSGLTSTTTFSAIWISNAKLELFNSVLKNVNCPTCNGAALAIQNSTFNVVGTMFSQNIGHDGGSILLLNNPAYGNVIASSIFQGSTATKSGGAIYLVNTSAALSGNSFKQNGASNLGGAVYTEIPLNSAYNVTVTGNNFEQNQAQQGATISYWGKKYEENPSSPNQMKNNVATQHGTNSATYPRSIETRIKLNNVWGGYGNDQLTLRDIRSGGQIPIELQFRLMDENGEFMFTYNPPAGEFLRVNFTTSQVKVQGQSQWEFKNGEIRISNLTVLGDKNVTLKLIFYSNAIYEIRSDKTSFKNDFVYSINIEFRDCSLGEVYLSNSRICEICGVGLYSLTLGEQICKKCPKDAATCPGGYKMNVSAGYWRENTMTDLIEKCEANDDVCLGGFDKNQTCDEGHIGALCESCDINARLWPEKYASAGEGECIKCSETGGQWWQIALVFILLFVGITKSIAAIFKDAFKSIIMSILRYFDHYKRILAAFGKEDIEESQDESSLYIKLLLNFFAMAAILNELQLKATLPALGTFVKFGGAVAFPTVALGPYLDCIVASMSTYPPVMFIRVVTNFLIGAFILIAFILAFICIACFKMINPKFITSAIVASLLFVFMYIQPGMVAIVIDLITCREIGGKRYVTADVYYQCYTSEHTTFVLALILPVALFFIILIPAFMFYKMYKNKHEMYKYTNILKYDFIMGEYREERFYWEFVRMYMRVLIVVVFKFMAKNIKEKAIVVVLIIFCYYYLSFYLKPYALDNHNKIDRVSCIVIFVSILLALFIISNPYSGLVTLAIIIIIVLISSFTIFCLYHIFFSLFDTMKVFLSLHANWLRKIPIVKNTKLAKGFYVDHLWSVAKKNVKKHVRKGKKIIIGLEDGPIEEDLDLAERRMSLEKSDGLNLAEINIVPAKDEDDLGIYAKINRTNSFNNEKNSQTKTQVNGKNIKENSNGISSGSNNISSKDDLNSNSKGKNNERFDNRRYDTNRDENDIEDDPFIRKDEKNRKKNQKND